MPKNSPLASLSATRSVLDAHGLTAKHALGQNFLVNDDIIGKILQLSQADESDVVLEVGPGIGTLTTALLQRAGLVVSVERDADLPPVLASTCAPWAERFILLEKDALRLDPKDWRGAGCASDPSKLISNLPYEVASTLVLDYFRRFHTLRSATVMVQKEVGQRMMAKPGTKDYGAYTVKLQLHAQPAGWFAVGPKNFFPAPRVESMVVRLDRREICAPDGEPLTSHQREMVCRMADAAFAARRKTIANSCKQYFSSQGEEGKEMGLRMGELLEKAGIDPRRRGETLSLDEFIMLGCLV